MHACLRLKAELSPLENEKLASFSRYCGNIETSGTQKNNETTPLTAPSSQWNLSSHLMHI